MADEEKPAYPKAFNHRMKLGKKVDGQQQVRAIAEYVADERRGVHSDEILYSQSENASSEEKLAAWNSALKRLESIQAKRYNVKL